MQLLNLGETITGNRLLVDKESERIVENKTNELTTRNGKLYTNLVLV